MGLGVPLFVVEESHLYRFVEILSTSQIWLKVEEAEAVEGTVGRSHLWVGPARRKGKNHCGVSRWLRTGGRTRRTTSGLELLLLWTEA